MDNPTDTTRRSVLQGFPLAAVAASIPLLLARDVEAGYSPIPTLIERHKAARIVARDAAKASDAVMVALHAANATDPIMVELPGILAPRAVPVTQTSPAAIREIYADYGSRSGKGGAVAQGGRLVMVDLSAARARDEAQALANLDNAFALLRARAAAFGEPVADTADMDAVEVENNARLALLSCAPASSDDAKAKADYLLSILDADPDWLDPIDVRALVASIGGSK